MLASLQPNPAACCTGRPKLLTNRIIYTKCVSIERYSQCAYLIKLVFHPINSYRYAANQCSGGHAKYTNNAVRQHT